MAGTATITKPTGKASGLRQWVAEHTRPWRVRNRAFFQDSLALVEGVARRSVIRFRRVPQPVQILLIDDLVPDPLLGAGYPRAFAAVWSLVRAGHHVEVYPMESQDTDLERMAQAFGGRVRFHPGRGGAGLRRLLWRRGREFDILFVSRPTPMRALRETGWTAPATAVIYDAEAVLAPRDGLRLALLGTPLSSAEQNAALEAELDLARGADVITAVSPRDVAMIETVLDTPVFVVSHPVSVKSSVPGFNARRDLLFVGRLTGLAAHSANVDSLQWFLKQVMPALDALIGDEYRLHIAGLLDAPELDALMSARVMRHGVVDDLTPLYDRCRLFVAPTRYAAGIPLKVVEAMGQGISCVATPLLAEQLRTDAAALPSGGSATDFARACATLYTDASAWQSVQQHAAKYVDREHSQSAFDRALANAVNQALSCRMMRHTTTETAA